MLCTHLYSIVILVFTSCVSSQWVVQDSNTCQTPNRVQGTCINLRQCAVLVNLLQSNAPNVPPDVIRFVQRSNCGFQGSDPLVCCPPSTTPATTEPTNLNPPDVTNHPNVRLLPNDICGPINDKRIVGGNVTGLFQYPWMALISYNTRTGPAFRCGGTLISRRYVLTAAHCVTNLPGGFSLASVRLGEHDISTTEDCENDSGTIVCASPVQDFGIEQAIPHPMYNPKTLQYDIGLVRLNADANTNEDNVKPICLPAGAQRNRAIRGRVFVAGWGATENGTSSSKMLRVALPVVPNEQCASVYNRSTTITYRQMCAGGTMGMDSCSGDSGGPLKVVATLDSDQGDSRYFQYGVVSFGPRVCGVQGRPGVYTRVVYFMDWILQNMRD